MLCIITTIVVLFVSYLIYKDPSIVNRSISYSYYEDRQTAVVWGSFAGVVGMIIAFWFHTPITIIAGICLTLVPIAGDFDRKPITYIHYTLALIFYMLMLMYSGSFQAGLTYAIFTIVLLWSRNKKLSVFWVEVIGIIVILLNLFINQ